MTVALLMVLPTAAVLAPAIAHLASPGPSGGPSPTALPASGPSAPTLKAPGPIAAAAPATTGAPAAHIHPAVTLPCSTTPPWPVWSRTGWGLPPNPFVPDQVGCALYESQDEVHASFLSSVSGSGSRYTETIHLPAKKNQTDSYSGIYLGMVVRGDNRSAWNQSYLEVSFFPETVAGQLKYQATISIYTLRNGTSGTPEVFACPGGWNGLAWNNSGWCEGPDFTGGGLNESWGSIAGNSWFNVTFAGTPKTGPVTVWANDSTAPSNSFSATMDKATTGTYNFTPAYDAACQTCVLYWGMGFGNGIGIGICPASSVYAQCNSYNIYAWTEDPPVEFGIPEYWNATAASYSGDFQHIGFESASGACSLVPGTTGPVSICQSGPNGTGFYPYFTYNGTRMDFGTTYPWTTWDFGGSSLQYNVQGTMTPRVPFSLDQVGDSSRGGYVMGGHGFNVTTRLQVVGHIVNASLVYKVGAFSWSSVALTQVNGSSSHGYFNASVPAIGPNGTISYFLFALDRAGLASSSQIYTVSRGPLPVFHVGIVTVPRFCGGPTINGTPFVNGQTADLTPGNYPLAVRGCYPYINPVFSATKQLLVHLSPFELTVRGNGTLTLSFTFNPPNLTVHIQTGPTGCGSLTLGGTGYSDGQTATVVWNVTYTLSDSPCANKVFSGYSFTSGSQFNVTVGTNSQSFNAVSNGTLIVHFTDSVSALPILFSTGPSGCGGVQFWGTVFLDGTTIAVASGSYPIAPHPCAKWGFLKWALTGGANVSNGNVSITASATIEEVNYHLTIVSIVTNPVWCGTIQLDGVNYTNGQSVVVANNSTHLVVAFACTNYSLLALTADGGLTLTGNTLTANGSGDVIATFLPGNGSYTAWVGFITDPAYCGSINFEGLRYQHTNSTMVAPGTIATLSANPCPTYGFLSWSALGGNIHIVGNNAYINGSGAIEAHFSGLVNIFLRTEPTGCGAILLGGVPYLGNTTPEFPAGINLTLDALPCAGYRLSTWIHTPDAVLFGPYITIAGPAQLEAVFVPVTYRISVFVNPANCGIVTLSGQPAYNNSVVHLGQGDYPLIIHPCSGESVVGFTVAGNLSLAGNRLFVNGSGSITILMEPVPPTVLLYVPSSTEAGLAVDLGATVATPIYPYNYTYSWGFGDGGSANTNVNFTEHTYSTPGLYHVTVTITDPLGRVASANSTVNVVPVPSQASLTNLLPAALAIAGAALVVGAAYFFTTPRRRSPAGAEPEPEGLAPPETVPEASESAPAEPLPKEP